MDGLPPNEDKGLKPLARSPIGARTFREDRTCLA